MGASRIYSMSSMSNKGSRVLHTTPSRTTQQQESPKKILEFNSGISRMTNVMMEIEKQEEKIASLEFDLNQEKIRLDKLKEELKVISDSLTDKEIELLSSVINKDNAR